MDLKGKVVIVTGASGGIGAVTVKNLIEEGAWVACLARDKDKLEQLKENLPNDKCGIYQVDITNSERVDQVVSAILSQHGTIDVLVNNAGILRDGALVSLGGGSITPLSLELWHEVLDTNLNGTYYMTRAVIPAMIKGKSKGVVVNISSISRNGNPGQSAYAASKAALDAATKTWAQELGFFKIRVVGIAPGLVDTPMLNGIPANRLAEYMRRIPLGRKAQPQDIAEAILSVIKNDYINGTTIEVDGGFKLP